MLESHLTVCPGTNVKALLVAVHFVVQHFDVLINVGHVLVDVNEGGIAGIPFANEGVSLIDESTGGRKFTTCQLRITFFDRQQSTALLIGMKNVHLKVSRKFLHGRNENLTAAHLAHRAGL